MIFVDTNVFMYAVGRDHPLRKPAQRFLERATSEVSRVRLCTSAEVVQELLHAYLPVARLSTLDAAMRLVVGLMEDVWAVEVEDVRLARLLVDAHPGLGARDLLHVACCTRHDVAHIKTYDRALAAVMPVD